MKKHILIVVLLLNFAIIIAQTKIQLGEYQGSIGISNNMLFVSTNFEVVDQKISGNYKYGITPGTFSNCKLSNHTLSCDWEETTKMKGIFKAIFNDEYSSFIAIWYYAKGEYGGAWTGFR